MWPLSCDVRGSHRGRRKPPEGIWLAAAVEAVAVPVGVGGVDGGPVAFAARGRLGAGGQPGGLQLLEGELDGSLLERVALAGEPVAKVLGGLHAATGAERAQHPGDRGAQFPAAYGSVTSELLPRTQFFRGIHLEKLPSSRQTRLPAAREAGLQAPGKSGRW